MGYAWFPPFRCRFAVPFCRSVVPLPLRMRTEMLETPFRVHRDEVARTLIGCSPIRQNGKNRIRSYLLGNGSYGAMAGGNGNGATEFFT